MPGGIGYAMRGAALRGIEYERKRKGMIAELARRTGVKKWGKSQTPQEEKRLIKRVALAEHLETFGGRRPSAKELDRTTNNLQEIKYGGKRSWLEDHEMAYNKYSDAELKKQIKEYEEQIAENERTMAHYPAAFEAQRKRGNTLEKVTATAAIITLAGSLTK